MDTVADQISIFIPTFNRWEILSKTLFRTLSNLPENFVVRIINNGSFVEGREGVESVISDFSHIDCKIIDNPVNIGGEANFLRCVELCETPYVLVLGDDDYLKEDFFKEIEFYISQENQWGWVNFQVKRGKVRRCQEGQLFDNPFHMVSSCNNWAELMFISTSIFSVDLLRAGLSDGHQWQSTWSVLVLTILKGWENKEQSNSEGSQWKFLLSEREIVDLTGCADAHYNQVDVYRHLPIIDRVSFETLDRKKIVRNAVRGGVKDVFKPRVLVKHFYSMVWNQSFSKTLIDYDIVSQGLLYMVGAKAYFYRFYMLVMIMFVWSVRFFGKLIKPVMKVFQ